MCPSEDVITRVFHGCIEEFGVDIGAYELGKKIDPRLTKVAEGCCFAAGLDITHRNGCKMVSLTVKFLDDDGKVVEEICVSHTVPS